MIVIIYYEYEHLKKVYDKKKKKKKKPFEGRVTTLVLVVELAAEDTLLCKVVVGARAKNMII